MYEQIKFETWQELAKYVIDGGEVYWFGKGNTPKLVKFHCSVFNADIPVLFGNTAGVLYVKKQPTLEELIAIKPRLCWVWDCDVKNRKMRIIDKVINGKFVTDAGFSFEYVQMLTDDEIKKFLSDGDN